MWRVVSLQQYGKSGTASQTNEARRVLGCPVASDVSSQSLAVFRPAAEERVRYGRVLSSACKVRTSLTVRKCSARQSGRELQAKCRSNRALDRRLWEADVFSTQAGRAAPSNRTARARWSRFGALVCLARRVPSCVRRLALAAVRRWRVDSSPVSLSGETVVMIATWLILPVVICLSQRLSHACLSTSLKMVKPRMAH